MTNREKDDEIARLRDENAQLREMLADLIAKPAPFPFVPWPSVPYVPAIDPLNPWGPGVQPFNPPIVCTLFVQIDGAFLTGIEPMQTLTVASTH